jgi:hypothetical protein
MRDITFPNITKRCIKVFPVGSECGNHTDILLKYVWYSIAVGELKVLHIYPQSIWDRQGLEK